MPKITVKRVGLVRLSQVEGGRWRAAWWSSSERRYVRRVLPASSYKDAQEMAREINKGLVSGRGFLPSMRNNKGGITVVDAITQMIQNSKAGNRCRKDYKSAADCFLRWLAEVHPGLESWGDLRPSHISQYVTHCETQGLAYDSTRKRLFILKAASRFMSEEYEQYRDIARKVKIQKPDIALEGGASMIGLESVQALIEHAGQTNIDKAAMLSLMAFCGLRQWEAAFLRECDIDTQTRTIKVDVTPHHKPKSRDSRRLIPIPRQVADTLALAISKNKVRGGDCYIFQSGRPAILIENKGQGWSMPGVSAMLRHAVGLAYRDTRRENLKDFIPRRLRSFFVTLITTAGASDVYVRRYIGHAPLNVMERHYLKVDLETLRKEICGRIESILAGENAKIKWPLPTANLQ